MNIELDKNDGNSNEKKERSEPTPKKIKPQKAVDACPDGND